MANTPRSWLKKALQKKLVPAFRERGFDVVPLGEDEGRDRENRVSFPFGRFRRMRNNGSLEVAEIQLAPYGEAAFRINFGIVPKEGIETQFGHFEQEKVDVAWLSRSWELYDKPRRWKWFKVRRWPWQEITEHDQIELVDNVVSLLSEIEDVFMGGKPGPHVRQFDRRL